MRTARRAGAHPPPPNQRSAWSSRALARVVALGLAAAACTSREPPPDGAAVADGGTSAGGGAPDGGAATPDGGAAAALPPVPPPTRPFSAGDTIPEDFAREPANTTGHVAFEPGLPIPWRCTVVSRTKTTIAARCATQSGLARSYFSRLHQGFGRDMFGGRWNEEEQFAFFERPHDRDMRIHVSADRDEALFGALTNGAELRVAGEPAGRPAPDPAPAGLSADDLLLRAFGSWSCGSRTILFGVRRLVVVSGGLDAVCGAIAADPATGARTRIRCGAITGDFAEVLGAETTARWRDSGIPLEVSASAIQFDGAACRRANPR